MKQLLLASTALVAFAGAAAAEVTVSGQGRFGVVASNGPDILSPVNDVDGDGVIDPEDDYILTDNSDVAFSSRLRVIFGMSFESDSGLTFGGTTRADNAAGANNGTAGSVFVSGDFGKLQMGDTDSAAEAAVGNISGVGYTGIGDWNETFYLLSGGGDPLANDDRSFTALPAALYSYTTGGFTLYVGLGNPAGNQYFIPDNVLNEDGNWVLPNGAIIPGDTVLETNNQYSLGVAWANDQFSFGLGWESLQLEDVTITTNDTDYSKTFGGFYVGGSATFGGAVFKAMYGNINDFDYDQYGLSVDYTFDAFTATAFFRTADYGDITGLDDRTAYGIGGTYDMGGGVLIKGGVVDPDIDGTYYEADLGVTFNF